MIAAGPAKSAQAMIGRTVAIWGSGTYARYCKVGMADAMLMPDSVSPNECASAFINPVTVLGMVETMRREGFTALVHTAAASNVGQMLCRVCLNDGIALVNIVRDHRQMKILRSLGAENVCNSSLATFDQDLQDAVRATGARLAFDATGGGILASRILAAMDRANMEGQPFRQYGSTGRKKVYMYSKLDPSPLEVAGGLGLSWDIGGWLVYNFVAEAEPGLLERLKARIADEIKTTFATTYSKSIGLDDALNPDVLAKVCQFSTGGKYLIEMRHDWPIAG